MKYILTPAILASVFWVSALPGAAFSPAFAQETPPETAQPGDVEEGVDLLEQGARLLLRGLMAEVEPALTDMGKALAEMEPAVRDLMEMIGDFRNFEAPEKMPNGDIIIRRKTPDLPPDLPIEPPMEPEGEIEL